jgi:diaminopropionate ammonia-lyase
VGARRDNAAEPGMRRFWRPFKPSEHAMFLRNTHPDRDLPLAPSDAAYLGDDGANQVEQYLARRSDHAPTPLHALPSLARELGVRSIHIKDEGQRLGLGSFKALGGSYAVVRLVLEEASRQLGRTVDASELQSAQVRAVASGITVGCATDGNHGRSVAAGARLVGAKAAIFVHEGVSPDRVAAIARFGAQMIRVAGTYDDAVAEAARRSAAEGWLVVSDTSWPGYERIPFLVMQGYTVMVREALRAMPELPTHVFVQAGVGGLAAAVGGHLALVLGASRPRIVVVEPARAACVLESARAGHAVKIPHGEPTVMAMLECYEPSLAALRVLSHVADAFMTVDEEDAVHIMRRLARPPGGDPAIVAGESGGVGLAGFVRAAQDDELRADLAIDANARVFVVNTEGATDPTRYRELVGTTDDGMRSDTVSVG